MVESTTRSTTAAAETFPMLFTRIKFPGHSARSLKNCSLRLCHATKGSSLVEVAVFLPIVVMCGVYAVEFAYFFIISTTLLTSSRNAVEYSIQGYQSPGQIAVPAAGPVATTSSVSSLALADVGGISATTATVQVCSKSVGVSSNVTKCVSYGPTVSTSTATAPQTDPEAPTFLLNRVDVTYTVKPPIPVTWFKVSLVPSLSFHTHASMRMMD